MTSGETTDRSSRIVIWNVAWAGKVSPRGRILYDTIFSESPDVVCITEGLTDWMPSDGHVILSDADYGYVCKPGRRKVLLWSRMPWNDVDSWGTELLPGGRFVSGVTETTSGKVEVIGVCIPWADAHVRTGRKDRVCWEDHKAYLIGLKHYLNLKEFNYPTLVVGDFNQAIPRRSQPTEVAELLNKALDDSFFVATAGIIPNIDKPAIDHLAHTGDVTITQITGLSNYTEGKARLSDHFGLSINLSISSS